MRSEKSGGFLFFCQKVQYLVELTIMEDRTDVQNNFHEQKRKIMVGFAILTLALLASCSPIFSKNQEIPFVDLEPARFTLVQQKAIKPSDASLFINDKEEISNGFTIERTGAITDYEISYSRDGLNNLRKTLDLPSSFKIIVYNSNTINKDPASESPALMFWDETKCTASAIVNPIKILTYFVLPKYDESEWGLKQTEIIEQWNHWLQKSAWHEASHFHGKKECRLNNFTPQYQAIAWEKQAVDQPLLFWVSLQGKLQDNDRIESEWRVFSQYLDKNPEIKKLLSTK